MADHFQEVKINVRSLLTISQKNLSIEQLQKDYYEQEGEHIPYKRLGFNSAIELLQNMQDILTLPPNPNLFSIVSLIVGDKTIHLRNLVVKQKSNSKKKNRNSSTKGKSRNHTNYNRTFSQNNSYKYGPNLNGNFRNNSDDNKFKNMRNYNYRFRPNTNTNDYNTDLSSSNSKSSSDLNGDDINQDDIYNTGFVTNEMRAYLEKYISENQMLITVEKLKELVRNHPDYLTLKSKDVSFKEFFNVTEKGITLKNTHQLETIENIPLTNHSKYTQNESFKPVDVNNLVIDNSLQNTSNIKNTQNNSFKPVDVNSLVIDNSLQNTSNIKNEFSRNYNQTLNCSYKNCYGIQNSDLKIVSDLYEFLKNDEDQNEKDIFYSTNQRMIGTQQDDLNKSLKFNMECEKSQPKFKENENIETRFSNGFQSDHSSNDLSNTHSVNSLKIFSHSTPEINSHKVVLKKYVPKEVLTNIGQIFKVYHSVNIRNFKFIYYQLHHIIIDPVDYGYTSNIEFFENFHRIIKIKDNVLYSIFEGCSNLDKSNNNNLTQTNIVDNPLSINKLNISLNVEQQLLTYSKTNMFNAKLVEAYDPSLFYLQFSDKMAELDCLMNQMQIFYGKDNESYYVQPESILLGSIYVSSYSTSQTPKQWHRVRVLKEVNAITVMVIQVDYGIMHCVLKTELRYLRNNFCNLPCQAIHCCLTDYNELDDKLVPKLLNSFLNIIDNKPVRVKIDKIFIFNKDFSIFHVTLFQCERYNKYKLKNINYELTQFHL